MSRTRKQAMELLRGKSTQKLLSKQMFWQFQLVAIKDETGPDAKQIRRQLRKELRWINKVLSSRDNVSDIIKEQFGSVEGAMDTGMIGLSTTSWNNEVVVDIIEKETFDKSVGLIKVISDEDDIEAPPKQVIGMGTLKMSAKRGSEN